MWQSSAWQSHTTQTGGGAAEEILGTIMEMGEAITQVPIMEMAGILDQMEATILGPTLEILAMEVDITLVPIIMAMEAGILDLILVTTLGPILEMVAGILVLDQTMEMGDGTLDDGEIVIICLLF